MTVARDTEQGILPLINIVFLLLIFFMVVGQLAPVDELVDEPLESVAGNDMETAHPPLTLQMAADGRLALEGVELEEEALLDRLSDSPAGGSRFRGLWFKVDGRADAATVIRLMNRLTEAGVPDARLLTLRADQPDTTDDADTGPLQVGVTR